MLADTNFWLALTLSKHTFHPAAGAVFARATRANPILFCRLTQLSLVRLLTTDAVTKPYGIPSFTNADAWDVYQGIRADTRCGFAQEPAGIEAQWEALAARTTSSPKLWMDAYLAAFALAGGHKLITTDKGFKQFKGLNAIIL